MRTKCVFQSVRSQNKIYLLKFSSQPVFITKHYK